MKKSILIIALMLIGFGMKTIAGTDKDCYVKVGDKVYSGKDLKFGLFNTKLIAMDGTVTKFPNRDVTAYRHHDKMYMLLPVICESNDTICYAMMKYITSNADYSVFEYCCPQNGDLFFVYKNGKFYRRINSSMAKDELAYYDIKVR